MHHDWRAGEQWFMQRLLDGEIAPTNHSRPGFAFTASTLCPRWNTEASAWPSWKFTSNTSPKSGEHLALLGTLEGVHAVGVADGDFQEAFAGFQAELCPYVAPVRFHGFHTQVERGGDGL
jgi:hypothetical protein